MASLDQISISTVSLHAEISETQDPRPSTSNDTSASADPPKIEPRRETGGNGYGLVHEGYIYGVLKGTELAKEYEKLATKQERRDFIIRKGEKRGKVHWDTRRKCSAEVRTGTGTGTG